jgi:hypothetical protein
MLTVAVACYGLALMTLVHSILQRLDGMSFAGLVGLCISLGITLLSPIGGTGGYILAGILTDMGMLNAAIYSAIYGLCTASGVTADTVQKGVNGVFLTAGTVTVIGVVTVLTKVSPMLEKEA